MIPRAGAIPRCRLADQFDGRLEPTPRGSFAPGGGNYLCEPASACFPVVSHSHFSYPTMNVENAPAAPAAKPKKIVSANPADRYSNAGNTPDPWDECARLEYGADRSFAWSVREQVIATPPEGRERVEEKLLNALAASGRTDAGLAFICQMLAMVASAKSVPALTPLLRAAKTADSARYTLERIAGPEADTAFRDALGALTGTAKAGLIGSIGVRGDTAATSALTALKDASAEPAIVREAATRALERLANSKA